MNWKLDILIPNYNNSAAYDFQSTIFLALEFLKEKHTISNCLCAHIRWG